MTKKTAGAIAILALIGSYFFDGKAKVIKEEEETNTGGGAGFGKGGAGAR